MKRYVRFGPAEAARLSTLAPLARPHMVRIAKEFYERIREHEAAHAVFTGEEQIARLQRSLVVWMERLLTGPHDEVYFEERSRVGQVHVRIGLPQRYMFTSMALVRASLVRVTEELPPADVAAARDALDRALDLELAIMVEAYRDALADRLAKAEREERERLMQLLARSERRYVNAVDLARVLLIGLDREGRIGAFSRELERITGLGREDVLGRDVAVLPMPERFPPEERARLRRFARGEELVPERWEIPLLTPAGHERLVEWHLARVPETVDDEVVLVAVGHDVTEEREREERVRRSEKLAAVGTLAAGLAHEIRNPLNGALLHVTFLERAMHENGATDDARGAVKFVADELRRLSLLVTEFLVFARPSAPDRKPTSVHELCKHAVHVVGPDAPAGTDVVADLSVSDVVVGLDAAKIEQVLLNLLRNAVDAVGGAGGGHVTLRERRLPRHIQLDVEDDGPGLPSPDAPVFDAFYTTKPAGTGLGLSIVHRIVSDHGGTVTVDSRPGRTVFRVLLPLDERGGES